MNRSDIPENIWRLMSPEDQALIQQGGVSAARGVGKHVRRREANEQKIVNAWLNNRLRERQLYPINPRSDKATTIRRGHPDYTIFLPNARVLLLEMKVELGVLSPEQIECIELLSDLGYAVELPASANEAIGMIKKYL